MAEQGDTRDLNGVIPHIVIRDNRGEEAIAFYKTAFGAEETRRNLAQDGKRLMHAQLRINGGLLFLNDDFPEFMGGPSAEPASVTLNLSVDDADAWWERATAAGATIVFPLADQFWGDRYGQIKDPFGHKWAIGAPVKKG
jgi:PhnB protein